MAKRMKQNGHAHGKDQPRAERSGLYPEFLSVPMEPQLKRLIEERARSEDRAIADIARRMLRRSFGLPERGPESQAA